MEPSAAPARARGAPTAATTASGGGLVGEFFAALGDDWRLTAIQRARLAPAVRAALGAGWIPHALAAFTGANTVGVRSPYAMLATRLSPDELPPPPGPRLARLPWCGECDQVTRMLGFDGDEPRRVPGLQASHHTQPRQSRYAVAPRPHRCTCAARTAATHCEVH